MSEPIPGWCPYCSAAPKDVQPGGTRYTCGSQVTEDGGITMNVQRELCMVRELAQLRERVDRLLKAGNPMADWLRNPHNVGSDPGLASNWDEAKGQL